MTFKVIVTYQVHNGTILIKEMTGVEQVKRTWEKIGWETISEEIEKDGESH